ncbi:MAG: type IV pilus assembly protein PilM [Planctomycetes bacterium]|nr:type IV pilus assembly protein PilM [Planctomycetota bacterium]
MAVRNLVGLDVGSKFVKALQLTENNGRFSITEFACQEIPPQLSPMDAVLEMFSRKRFKTRRVATSVSGRFVFVRYINMPLMSEDELVNAAKYELGKYIPVEVDEVLHDSQKLEDLPHSEGQEAEMRVLLVAAKRTFIDEHVAMVEQAGLQPVIVDVDSFALGNAYELTSMVAPDAVRPGKLVALADIGATKTNINIVSDTTSCFTREFYKGGDDVTDAISKKLGIEPAEAENLKRAPQGEEQRILDCISGTLEDICHDINISVDYFENQYDKKVDEIFLTGGAANTLGLDEALEKTVQKKVWKWKPTQHVEVRMDAESTELMNTNASSAAIALGLASRLRRD